MVTNTKLSQAMKGNKNAAGKRGGFSGGKFQTGNFSSETKPGASVAEFKKQQDIDKFGEGMKAASVAQKARAIPLKTMGSGPSPTKSKASASLPSVKKASTDAVDEKLMNRPSHGDREYISLGKSKIDRAARTVKVAAKDTVDIVKNVKEMAQSGKFDQKFRDRVATDFGHNVFGREKNNELLDKRAAVTAKVKEAGSRAGKAISEANQKAIPVRDEAISKAKDIGKSISKRASSLADRVSAAYKKHTGKK